MPDDQPADVVILGPSLFRSVVFPYVVPAVLSMAAVWQLALGDLRSVFVFGGLLLIVYPVSRRVMRIGARVTRDEVIVGDWQQVHYVPVQYADVVLRDRPLTAFESSLEDDNNTYATRSLFVTRLDDPGFAVRLPNIAWWTSARVESAATDFRHAIHAARGQG